MSIGALFGRIFGTEKALNTAVEGISNGIDKLVYTQEERAEQRALLLSEGRQVMIEWLKNSQGQNIARRFLAVLISCTWLAQYAISMLLNMAAIWMPDPTKVMASAQLVGDYAEGMTGAMMLILAFYFAAPHIGEIVGPALNRFGKRPEANQ